MATANGLLFIATALDRKFRAYDQDSGQVLWEKELSAGAEGVPAVYEIAGREYIALCAAAGDGDLHIDTDKPACLQAQARTCSLLCQSNPD